MPPNSKYFNITEGDLCFDYSNFGLGGIVVSSAKEHIRFIIASVALEEWAIESENIEEQIQKEYRQIRSQNISDHTVLNELDRKYLEVLSAIDNWRKWGRSAN